MRALVALGTAAAVASCAHVESTQTSGGTVSPATSATPGTAAPARPAPHLATTGAVIAKPSAAATVAPVTSVAPTAAVATMAPTGPRIYSLSESPSVVHAGDSVSFAASTSPDIESVTATVAAYTLPFVHTGAGRFALAFAIPPNVPGMFHGTYALAVTAKAHGGASVSRSISVTFQ